MRSFRSALLRPPVCCVRIRIGIQQHFNNVPIAVLACDVQHSLSTPAEQLVHADADDDTKNKITCNWRVQGLWACSYCAGCTNQNSLQHKFFDTCWIGCNCRLDLSWIATLRHLEQFMIFIHRDETGKQHSTSRAAFSSILSAELVPLFHCHADDRCRPLLPSHINPHLSLAACSAMEVLGGVTV